MLFLIRVSGNFRKLRRPPNVSERGTTVLITIFNMADDIDAFNPFENENGDDAGEEDAILPHVSSLK